MSRSKPSFVSFTVVVLLACSQLLGCSNGGKKNPSPLPGKATNPQPAQNAFDVPVTTNLTWATAVQVESYDAYFGTGSVAVENADNSSAEFKGNQTDLDYDPPSDLSYSTTYYWRIDSVNAFGSTKGDVWFFTTELSGNVICVDDAGGNDGNDGSSWSTAVKTIQKGLDLAGASGWSVLVAAGTYKGTGNKSLDFNGKAVSLKGAGGPSNCIIDCQNDGRAFYFHSGETSSAVVGGFCIQYGNAIDESGGGIYCDNSSSPTIRKCTIKFCHAGSHGGGIYFYENANANLEECTIQSNSVPNIGSFGGGIYCHNSSVTITNCFISCNSASRGGGIEFLSSGAGLTSPTVMGCTITGNSAVFGGGIECWKSNTNPKISNCVVKGNSASYGAGINLDTGSFATADISFCVISDNSAGNDGGGIRRVNGDTTLTNSLISGNRASGGGGIYGVVAITNCTIVANMVTSSGGCGGGVCLPVCSGVYTNTIIWGNKAGSAGNQIYLGDGGPANLNYCCFPDGADDVSGPGSVTQDTCIHLDPQFIDAIHGNYRLQDTSPCIDAGLNSAISGYSTDLDGNPRIVNGTVDTGAYEKQ